MNIPPKGTAHLTGICGTGMGALAGLLVQKGYTVQGSDANPYPPMSTELEKLGIKVFKGYSPENLLPEPDMVVVGNVCTKDHPEAVFAREKSMNVVSMPRAIREIFLQDKKSLVIAGTHGKTTTTALTSYLLRAAGKDPSFMFGGICKNFKAGYCAGSGKYFVIEGDEYDSAYFEKFAKFLYYEPFGAVITSVEHDHIDIYPRFLDYYDAFALFVKSIHPDGVLAICASNKHGVSLSEIARCDVVFYGIDCNMPGRDVWSAIPENNDKFTLKINGVSAGKFKSSLMGDYNIENTLGAMILCNRVAEMELKEIAAILPEFKGVKKRQELLGAPSGIYIYDDFAHHPTAVKKTLESLSQKHKYKRLLAVFEPRSATACRNIHQKKYARVFSDADKVIIAPVQRQIDEKERLDTQKLATEINKCQIDAEAARSIEEVMEKTLSWVKKDSVVVFLSNGGFGGIQTRIMDSLVNK